jgi:hypothetical protein
VSSNRKAINWSLKNQCIVGGSEMLQQFQVIDLNQAYVMLKSNRDWQSERSEYIGIIAMAHRANLMRPPNCDGYVSYASSRSNQAGKRI